MQYCRKGAWIGFVVAFGLVLAGCGSNGEDGSSCSTETLDDGSVVVSCEDGTSATVEAAGEAEGCSAEDNGDGTMTVDCPGSEPFVVDADGDDRCSATDNGDETYTIDCPGEDPVTVDAGSESCSAVDNGDGSYTVDCPGQDAITFDEDSQCELTDNGDGTHDLSCGDETVTVYTAVCGDGEAEGEEECDQGQETAQCTAQCESRHEYLLAGSHYDKLHVYDPSDGSWQTHSTPSPSSVQGGVVLEDGVVLFADYVFAGIHKIDLYTGQRTDFATGMGNASDVVSLPSGEIVATDSGLRIYVFDSSGTKLQEFNLRGSWSFAKLAVGPNGELYGFADECTESDFICENSGMVGTIVEIDIANESYTVVSEGGELTSAGDLVVDDAGTIWASTGYGFPSSGVKLLTIDPATGDQTVESLPSGLSYITGLDLTYYGELIAATGYGELWNLTTSTSLGPCASSPCGFEGLTYVRFEDELF
jgi:sugar lactone lactonase YvrE